jgi:F-type H+-transporting ATPase subunit delta
VEAAIREITGLGWPRHLPASVRFGRVVSAQPLTAEEMGEIQRAVAAMVGQPLYLHASNDTRLLGGVLVSLGDTVIDASVSGRLTQLYHQIHS